LYLMLSIFPDDIQTILKERVTDQHLIEVVIDLGRKPFAQFSEGEVTLGEREITQPELDSIVDQIGEFMGDNRAGIERTLHRISCIRNRRGKIIGLTCRVGRAVYGTIDIMQDLLESGNSVLLLGRPGVGKTTLLREAARILAESKRVVVVDTSNEIGGDGDIPHPAIGHARRMQVPRPELQHEVMIEAVENHTPQVIIIDEIGRLEEAEAARTIAERGVQLIGTAHGNTLDNLLVNPTLSDLVGGVDSVTLSDEEARRRNTQKTVLERKSPPTFDSLVEIKERDTLVVHYNVGQSVDNLLRQRRVPVELRMRTGDGDIQRQTLDASKTDTDHSNGSQNNGKERLGKLRSSGPWSMADAAPPMAGSPAASFEEPADSLEENDQTSDQPVLKSIRTFSYGANQGRLRQAARSLQVPMVLVDRVEDADVVITVKSQYRKHPQPIAIAEQRNIPIYVLRSNSINQMETCLIDVFGLTLREIDPFAIAMREAQDAIRKVLQGAKTVALGPQSSDIRRRQHELVRQSDLISHSYGEEPNRRVRIYRQ
ncbi:MAG: R3H domain-containing nucleic acid-binding protein, partial [Chloroflexota bacterium]